MSGGRSIAVVGVAGRFPGAADVRTLWENVVANRSAVVDVPEARWRVPIEDVVESSRGRPDRASSNRACLLEAFALDAAELALPAELVPRLSALSRLTLRVGLDACRSVRGVVPRDRASVILANIALPTDGASYIAEQLLFGPADRAMGGHARAADFEPLDAFPSAVPAGLLARALGLRGGSLTLDAACASSLYAIHLACVELEALRSDAVVCGGVALPHSLYTQVGFTQLQALSPRGRSAPYDASADGLVVGEGAAMIVLKRLRDAERDGDDVLAVIRGIGLSNDVGGSLLSPDSEGQLRAMRAAYADAGWQPDDVDLIEGHGTGTPRGDAVEVASLAELRRGRPARRCVLGSVKSNVGHMLTAAGLAGLCKVLEALRTRTLPPSANASTPMEALRDTPYRVLSAAEEWNPAIDGAPRRAAVSGFGFGGINAHVLVEEARGPSARGAAVRPVREVGAPSSIAIVGMAAHFGRLCSLESFKDTVLFGREVADELPGERWHGIERGDASPELTRLRRLRGAWMTSFALPKGRFKLPPNDVSQLLPQQLLMLKVAGEALDDARCVTKGPHLRFGTVIGIGLDLESTSFHLRWLARARARAWAASAGISLSEEELDAWTEDIKAAVSPALDATRTLGALGGIVPSRIAREFQLGGPSFAVSGDQASGLRAVEIAARLLQRREVDAMVVGAVDLAGDLRAVVAADRLRPFSPSSAARPFDARADGTKIAEGAAAVVLKRLDDAVAAGDRIYAVVRGLGAAGGAALELAGEREAAYVRAAESAYAEAGVPATRVGLVEAHGSAVPREDWVEARALETVFRAGESGGASTAIASTCGVIGHAGAAAGIASFVKAALCLHHQVLPPIGDLVTPTAAVDWTRTPFHFPRDPAAWVRDRADGRRFAAVSSMGLDGSVLHAVLEEAHEPRTPSRTTPAHAPASLRRSALFLLGGEDGGEGDRAELRALAVRSSSLETLAVRWHGLRGRGASGSVARAAVVDTLGDLVRELETRVEPSRPLGGSVAFVYPGSGNHFVGMGRDLALALPEVYRRLDAEVAHLAGHLQSRSVAPRRVSWESDWEESARRELSLRPERVIVAQVAHGIAVHDALLLAGVEPRAFVGYSLGESTALLASRAWADRDVLFERTLASPLFRSELAGARDVLRRAWGPDADWSVVIVTRPASEVRAALVGTAALLIVNAPRECVVGGRARDVDATVDALGCEAIPVEAVPTVHLPIVEPVRDAYRAHHALPTTPPRGTRFYSGALGRAYEPTEASAADSLVQNALRGFDFPAVIESAWADAVRVFVEVGPQGSCTRMIGRILEGRPHLAVSACQRGKDGFRTLLVAIGRVAEAGVSVNLDRIYAEGRETSLEVASTPTLSPVVLGGILRPLPYRPAAYRRAPAVRPHASALRSPARAPNAQLLAPLFAAAEATAAAHETFLRVSADALALQARLFVDRAGHAVPSDDRIAPRVPRVRFVRDECLEFAVGTIANVLGPAFAHVDQLPTRVRLPDDPLMLVDRIVSVEGVAGVLGPGRVVTEHDVLENAWYLDGDRAPVCISVEAGQADLFLSAYLGIDSETRGERVYRLLDAKIVFHRDLPRPGERIRYDIRIDRFIRQGETWLFFFRFDGTIDGKPFITMLDGCAGFFSQEQLASGRGIVPREPRARSASRPTAPFRPLVDVTTGGLTDDQMEALRRGDLASAFGPVFRGKWLPPSLRLPAGRMKLVDRVVSLDPAGGAAGLGEIVGEADVAPDAWYLACHFVDDQVMPGTLMYECCLHTLRVLLLRFGWISEDARADLHYGPVLGVASSLRCRGQVTRATKKVRYRVSIDEIGYDPEPYVLATAAMYADDKHVVQMDGMSVKLRGLTRDDVEATWAERSVAAPAFTRTQIVAYAEGNPSECFGPPYAAFDHERRLARLPRDPFLFVDRVVAVEPPPWVQKPGGWVTCAFDVDENAWYFGGSGQGTMPFSVLLEAALQPCGWLAAYLGSALLSDTDLHFRNLDGQGTQLLEVRPDAGTLTTRARLTKTSQAGGMILQEYDLEVLANGVSVYVGRTGFGFFPSAALAAQVGLRGRTSWATGPLAGARDLPRVGPRSPSEVKTGDAPGGLALPAPVLSMVDRVEHLDLSGGPAGLGLIVGVKHVDPEEWFFKAHFYQDPVMPGSLGLEAVMELLKVFARERFPGLVESHRFEAMALGQAHRWQYRGQVVPSNHEVRVEARISALTSGSAPTLVAEGQLSVDGKIIYSMTDFGLRVVPRSGV